MPELLCHTIPPVYDSRSRVLLLGSFPSPKSRETGFYYGNPQNRFWKVMACLLGEPFPEGIPARKQLLLSHGIALWDVLASCEIVGASDASIRNPAPNDLGCIFREAQIRAVFATGQKAAALYRRYSQPVFLREITALPSTSPANAAKSLEALCEAYRTILPYLQG